MSKVVKRLAAAIGAPALLFSSVLATAHHSAAQFDFSKRATIEGVVKEFNVKNPHTSAVIEVTDAKGTRDVEYEGHSASHFYRAGYTRDMVTAGDKISILISPRHDGEDGGFIQAFTVDGRTIGFGGLSPETGNPVDSGSDSASSPP
jgi:hypothetical protein